MSGAVRWIGFVAGAVLVLGTASSLFRQLVVPRGVNSKVADVVDRCVHLAFVKGPLKLVPRGRSVDPREHYERADRILAIAAPLSLLTLFAVWEIGLILGFSLMLWPFLEASFAVAVREAGSSFFTLGFFSTDTAGATGVDFMAAVAGLASVALLIAYLPTLYSSFARREAQVTTLEARAGAPPWGPEILARHSLVGLLESLPGLYDDWEKWSAELSESHANYPILLRFRSPDPYRSWIIGLTAVLDSAAMYLALAPNRAPGEARLCLRMGFTALRDISRTIHLPFAEDPRPEDPIALSYEEFVRGAQRIHDAGFPLERTPEEAWADFRGWRVNYETIIYHLADLIDAPPAPWSGTRTHFPVVIEPRRPVDRRPDDPEGRGSRIRYPPALADGRPDGAARATRRPTPEGQ